MVFCCILQCFVAKSVFLQATLFCREICFCTIYVVLRGEKLSQKLYPWRKNDKYEVCTLHYTSATYVITHSKKLALPVSSFQPGTFDKNTKKS